MRDQSTEVLIIEEDDDVGQSLSEMLTERGFEALAVRTGPKGLDLLDKGLVPRVIVLDPFTSNGWRGFRTAQIANPGWATIPVLIGGGLNASDSDATRAGREHHLGRPIDVEHLLELVNRYCRPWG
jgi:DNA-binding NtrC family response regulator